MFGASETTLFVAACSAIAIISNNEYVHIAMLIIGGLALLAYSVL